MDWVYFLAVWYGRGSLAVIFSVDYMKDEDRLPVIMPLCFSSSAPWRIGPYHKLLLILYSGKSPRCVPTRLISFNNDDPKAGGGGMKGPDHNPIWRCGFTMGALLIRSYLGSRMNDLLANWNHTRWRAEFAAVGFLGGPAAKSAHPLPDWLPPCMEDPYPISAIHAATMVNAGVYLLARFFPAFSHVPGWSTSVIVVGVLSALMAAIMAMVATDLKRVLAYSTVSQLGYMVYAVGAGGIFASQFHLLSHSVFKALLFLGAGAVIHAAGTRDMRQMAGFGKQIRHNRAVFVIGFAGSGWPSHFERLLEQGTYP
jgi:NADH-quinone oxidoreductase subunit L